MKSHAPFGSWPSTITAELVAGKTPRLSDVQVHNNHTFWLQTIAEEKGRCAIMMHDGKQLQCVLPSPLSAKSRVHEYGGGAYTVYQNHVFFVLADDQCVYRADFTQENFEPGRLSPEEGNFRYADLVIDTKRKRLIAVCEYHDDDDQEAENFLVALALDGSQEQSILAKGHDFYSNPRLSPDGDYLCWLTWDHPDMPWDNTKLWVAEISDEGKLANSRSIAGNGNESIFQPEWSASGDLFFVSDRDNWWNLFSIRQETQQQDSPQATCILRMESEFATPQWVFGMATYGFLNTNTLFAAHTQSGTWQLIKIDTECDKAEPIAVASPCTAIQYVSCQDGRAAFIGASPYEAPNVYHYDGESVYPLLSSTTSVSTDEYSVPEAITFPTTNGDLAQAFFYPPHNTQFEDPDGLPPLIVICHGGPTGASENSLNLKVQYWTNRGFAVVDVNYRGSTGYGRDYRHRLNGQWGVYDVDDICAVVDYLAERQDIDRQRCIVKGSSAGGYTVLAALAFRDTFSAGVSLYGVGELEALVRDTHKFESRYLDKLVGPYPELKPRYIERSPIHSANKITCPLILFQGLLDKVVPPNQTESMFDAVKAKGLPVAMINYPDEAHGFRNPDNIEHMLDCELQFYARVFDFALAAPSKHPLTIENMSS